MPKTKRKVQPITIRHADGREEVVRASEFAKRKFSYKRYIWSPEWHAVCEKVRDRDGNRCALCRGKSSSEVLEVHHLTYARLGRERLEDLITLCQRCHATEHQWMRRRGV